MCQTDPDITAHLSIVCFLAMLISNARLNLTRVLVQRVDSQIFPVVYSRSVPGRSMPEAKHSITRRRASPAPRGLLQVAIAFSQISSNGFKKTETHIAQINMQQ